MKVEAETAVMCPQTKDGWGVPEPPGARRGEATDSPAEPPSADTLDAGLLNYEKTVVLSHAVCWHLL